MLRIGILEAGETPDDMIPDHGTMRDCFGALLTSTETEVDCPAYAAHEGHLPGTIAECDAYLVAGSRHGVYDRLPWMADLADFAIAARGDHRKLIGICFGHQFLADAFGGKVVKTDKGWGVGLHRYEVHESRPWMAPPAADFRNVVHHQDQIVELPPGATVLAGNAFCPYGMVALDDDALLLQSHPEMTREFGTDLLRLRRAKIDEDVRRAAFESLAEADDSALVARWLLNFAAG